MKVSLEVAKTRQILEAAIADTHSEIITTDLGFVKRVEAMNSDDADACCTVSEVRQAMCYYPLHSLSVVTVNLPNLSFLQQNLALTPSLLEKMRKFFPLFLVDYRTLVQTFSLKWPRKRIIAELCMSSP